MPSDTFFLTFLRTRVAAVGLAIIQFLCLLRETDGLARTFARARIGARALAADRQAFAMTLAAVAAQVHQTLDVHGHFAAQIAFDGKFADLLAQLVHLG